MNRTSRISRLIFSFIYVFVLLNISCNSSDTSAELNLDELSNPDRWNKDTKAKTLLIIGDDRSGSRSDNRKFSPEDYRTIINKFKDEANGTIYVRVIGNPGDGAKEFFQFETIPNFIEYDVKELSEEFQLTLKEIRKVRSINKRIKELNDSINRINTNNANKLYDDVEKNVLGYKREPGKDFTDINEIFEGIHTILNEKIHRDVENFIIVLLSDGKHDAHKMKLTDLKLNDKSLVFLLDEWKDRSVFKSFKELEIVESKDEIIKYINNNIQ